MDKRFTRNAMFFSTLFLVMLVFAVAAFFYGINLGSKKTEQKYAHLQEAATPETEYVYQQQDLISFYLSVYSPYREFQNSWTEALNKIANNDISNVASLYKEIESQASKKAEEAASFNLQHAGLIGQAQQSYIRSLNQFEKAAAALQRRKPASYEEVLESLQNNEAYIGAVNQALNGQSQFYNAMHLWGSSIDPNIPSEFDKNVNQNFEKWSELPLLIKNVVIADYLKDKKIFADYLPHDLVSSIDYFISTGQAKSMNISTVDGVITLLLNTNAVRPGDYSLHRSKLYNDQFLPQIPFFYPKVD